MKSVAIRALVEAHLLGGVASLCAEHPNASASNGQCPEVQRLILAGGFATGEQSLDDIQTNILAHNNVDDQACAIRNRQAGF